MIVNAQIATTAWSLTSNSNQKLHTKLHSSQLNYQNQS